MECFSGGIFSLDQTALQQAGAGVVTFSYYLQFVIAPAVLAGLPWLKSRLGRFFDDFHTIATALAPLVADALADEHARQKAQGLYTDD